MKVEEGLGVRRPMRETKNEDPPSLSVGLTDHDRDKHDHHGENSGNTPFGSIGIGTISHLNALEGTTRRQRPAEEDPGNLKMLTSTIDLLIAVETRDPAQYRTMLDDIVTPEMLQAMNEMFDSLFESNKSEPKVLSGTLLYRSHQRSPLHRRSELRH